MKTSTKLRLVVLNVSILAIVVVFIYLLFFSHYGFKLPHTNIDEWAVYFRSFGSYALLLGIFIILLQTFIPFSPFFLIAAANVLVFGFTGGLIINYGAACLGAILAFLFARYVGHAWVERRMARFPKMNEFNKRMETEGFFYVLLGRLISFFPSSIINYGGGISKIKLRDFVLATLIGKFPIIFIECIIAHDLQHWKLYRGRVLLLLSSIILLIMIGYWMRKRSSRRQKSERS